MDNPLRDPFQTGTYITSSGEELAVSTVDGPGRLLRVKSFTKHECHAALTLDERRSNLHLQISVRRAILTRLRRLERLEETQ